MRDDWRAREAPPVAFTKMSASGNDFIVLDAAEAARLPDPEGWIRRVCQRALSVGADGVLVVGAATAGGVPVAHFNADGGRSALCGNGTRCAARWSRRRGLGGDPLRLLTDAGEVVATFPGGERVTVELAPSVGSPSPRRVDLPGGSTVSGFSLTVGIPHFVARVARVAEVPVDSLGSQIRRHPGFGDAGTNASFVELGADGSLEIRTFERGVERETLACGTACMAAAVVAADRGWSSAPVRCRPRSGIEVAVDFDRTDRGYAAIRLTGDARLIYEGRLTAEAARWGAAADDP
jgi:diaminopimelate epimerase